MKMEKDSKIAYLKDYVNESDTKNIDKKKAMPVSHQSNPIYKKNLIISVKNNIHKFSVADLFD